MIKLKKVGLNQNFHLYKRSYDFKQNHSPSKRIKYDSSISDTDTESKSFSSDTEDSNTDHNNDFEDDSNISTDQSQFYPVKTSIQQQIFSRNSKKLIKNFQYFNKNKTIELTKSVDETEQLRWQLQMSLNRIDLLKEGYAIFSDQSFPFYSLCYLCGSMGNDLIYCNNCCQAYHQACLNESERPLFYPTPESWLCPNCNVCNICGLLGNSQLITCFDCKRIFHIKCIKTLKNEETIYLNIHNHLWFCPLCIKCDCGEKLISNDENIFSLKNSVLSQQILMCTNCLNNMKIIQMNKTNKIEKCHLCNKFIEQFITKPKPLFSLSLIGTQTKSDIKHLLKCYKCQHQFHPLCDNYLNEDIILIPYISINIICSKCDNNQRENIQKSLINYKIQVVKTTISNIISTLQIIISEDNRLNNMKYYMSNLQQLYQSRNKLLNLHEFLNDLLIIIQHLLDNIDNRQWQTAINNCIKQQCPWFKSLNLFSTTNNIITCSSTIIQSNNFFNHCYTLPSIDHTYSLNNERMFFESNLYKINLLTSNNSLLRYMNNNNNEYDKLNSFENLYQIDTRMCQLCQIYADQISSNISRLISIGINQWIHIGCIIPAYSKILDQPPYILHNINKILNHCQTKFKCDLCFKMGASVQCYINDCNAHFHCQCIDLYYSKFDQNLKDKWNLVQGLLPNLTTLCLKHNQKKIFDEEINFFKIKSINLSSPIYVDLSNRFIEFSLTNIKLCIGSLQIKSFGNYDYHIDSDPNIPIYPNGYQASRVFWSTKNARKKTIYHLDIEIKQTYHNEKSNHQTIEYPLSIKQLQIEQLYQYFNKSSSTKTLENLLNSQYALAFIQALQYSSTKLCKGEPIFSYYVSNDESTNISRTQIDKLIQLYQQWSISKFGQIQFTIISDDGYKIISENLDEAWSTIVDQVRECRDDMNLTHFSMTNEELNGHQIFGLKKILLKQIFNREQTKTMILSNSNCLIKKKNHSKKIQSFNSRLNIYRRKSSQYQRFNWLLNPNRKIEYALNTFEIDPALAYAKQILLEEPSVSLRLYHLHYFSERVLIVGSSSIHGCGLFTLIDLVKGQMIIEYTGEVIRSCLTDKRERENEEKGFGCYMFTVDSMNVIDATHQGNKARFINHHCQPNCFAKTVISNSTKHIIIYALQNISRGSELTYDYSFPEEDIKIPCHCGTSNCRIYLN